MAVSRTGTFTSTYTRTALIKLQIGRVLQRGSIEARWIEAVMTGIDKGWICEVSLYGLDAQGYCHGEIYMNIDWSRNAFHLSAGRDSLSIDHRWSDGISVEVEKVLQLFEEYARDLYLSNIMHVRYTPGVDIQMVQRELGFVPASPVQWKSGAMGTAMSIPELDEFTVGIRLI